MVPLGTPELDTITPLAGLATGAAAPTLVSTLTLIRPDCAYRWGTIVVLLAVTEVARLAPPAYSDVISRLTR